DDGNVRQTVLVEIGNHDVLEQVGGADGQRQSEVGSLGKAEAVRRGASQENGNRVGAGVDHRQIGVAIPIEVAKADRHRIGVGGADLGQRVIPQAAKGAVAIYRRHGDVAAAPIGDDQLIAGGQGQVVVHVENLVAADKQRVGINRQSLPVVI